MQQKSAVKKKTEPTKTDKNTSSRGQLLFLIGSIVIVTYCCFSPALKNSFTNWDDNAYVFENPHLGNSLPDAILYFFGPHFFIGNYIPITMVTYVLEFHAAELDPQFYHTVNVLLHLANVVLVFFFIYLLSGKKPIVASIVALFFGIHPMHVESVAWIAELKDVLYSFFFLGGLIAYYKYIENKDEQADPKAIPKMLVAAFILFVLSVLSKPAAVTFPIVLLLLDFYAGRKFEKQAWIEKVPFFVVSVIFGIVAIKSQQADRLLHDYYPFSQRVFFASHSLLDYLMKLFLPINLSIFYPYPPLVDGHLPYFYYATPIVVILLAYGVYRTLKYTRLIAFGFLFFFANILLVLQLLSIGDAAMADRYTYIPYIGLLFIAAMGFDQLYHSTKPKPAAMRPVAVTLAVLVALACSYLTYARCHVWETDDTLADDLLEKFPEDRLALNNKGFILFEHGKYYESIQLFSKAIELKPDYVMAYINLINSYLALKDQDDAMRIADLAIKNAAPDFNILNTKGYLLSVQKRYPEAMKYYKDAIQLKANNTKGYIYLAACYYELQDYANWRATLDLGLKYDPDDYILLNNKGYGLFLEKKYNEALEYYKASLKRKPDYQTAQANMANCYKVMGDSSGVKN